MIYLDYQDRRPIYEQIVEKFRNLILNNVLPPGSKMPSVRQLAVDLAINPNTIQRAYMELEQEGLIYPVKGRGNFVADTDQIRRQSFSAYDEEMTNLVQKGILLGIEEQHLHDLITKGYRRVNIYHENETRRNEHDKNNGLQ